MLSQPSFFLSLTFLISLSLPALLLFVVLCLIRFLTLIICLPRSLSHSLCLSLALILSLCLSLYLVLSLISFQQTYARQLASKLRLKKTLRKEKIFNCRGTFFSRAANATKNSDTAPRPKKTKGRENIGFELTSWSKIWVMGHFFNHPRHVTRSCESFGIRCHNSHLYNRWLMLTFQLSPD